MKTKYIVTHANPDQDAICSTWLLKRFRAGWEEAQVLFVSAGETITTFKQKNPTSYSYIRDLERAEIIHVDTGFGEFDHHQDNRNTCAAMLVFEWFEKNKGRKVKKYNPDALYRLINIVRDIDHFREVYYPNASADYYDFMLEYILDGLKLMYNKTGTGSEQVMEFGLTAFDGLYKRFCNKSDAEEEISRYKGLRVRTKFGTAVGYETGNDAILHILQKQGTPIVVRKDPNKGYVRIKAVPEKGINLTPLYKVLVKQDPDATWFLHSAKTMLLNGVVGNKNTKPTTLTLEEIMNSIKLSLC
jgi:hypothetical protein